MLSVASTHFSGVYQVLPHYLHTDDRSGKTVGIKMLGL